VARCFQRLGEHGETRGDLPRYARRAAGRIERQRLLPHRPQHLPDFATAERIERDAERGRVRKLRVVFAGAREVGEQLEDVATSTTMRNGGQPSSIGRALA
jgi:hypothetical protein